MKGSNIGPSLKNTYDQMRVQTVQKRSGEQILGHSPNMAQKVEATFMTPNVSTVKGFVDRSLDRNKSLERAMLTDNPSNGQLNEINKYIRHLDKRLSIPKFTDEEGYSPRMRCNRGI